MHIHFSFCVHVFSLASGETTAAVLCHLTLGDTTTSIRLAREVSATEDSSIHSKTW